MRKPCKHRLRGRPKRLWGPLWALVALVVLSCGAAGEGPLFPGDGAAGGGGNTAAAPNQIAENPENGGDAGGGAPAADPTATLQGRAILGPGANSPLLALKAPIEAAAKASGVAANVLAGVIWDESRADPTVAGGGLMQIGPAEFAAQQKAHPEVVGGLDDAAANVMAGAFYLVELQGVMRQKYGRDDLAITLRAYNSGENGVDPNDLTHLPAGTGTAQYVAWVLGYVGIVASGEGSLPP